MAISTTPRSHQNAAKKITKKISSEKVAIRVAREIASHIYAERIPVGEKYLSEAEALEKFHVARGTLREALRYLQLQGVIDIRTGPKGGYFVGEPTWENLATTISLLMQFSHATIESVVEARGAIEPGMAVLAAENASKEEVLELEELLDGIGAHIEDYEIFYEKYMEVWDKIASCTGNPFFVILSPAMRRITWTAGIQPETPARKRSLRLLKRVVAAISEGDTQGAFDAMKKLEDGYLKNMRKQYSNNLYKTVSWTNFQT